VFSKRFNGFLSGQLLVRAVSLKKPAARKTNPKSQKFHQRICFGFSSICGIRFLLKLVAIPPAINKTGISHG
jgi:hypothetical protein